MTGYSDRIHHALAFADKHHDREVRKGTRSPYFTAPANLAVMLTRYAQDEPTVVAGILRQTVEDYLRDGLSADAVHERLADKFGAPTVDVLLAAVPRRVDDDGVELSHEEQKGDLLDRLAAGPDAARWVAAAHEVHEASALLADLRRTSFPESVWQRVSEGREARLRWYAQVTARLLAAGVDAAPVAELASAADALGATAH
ncbi:HD domain-containing protein [Roseisolibacter sp. H3M3-2]|uniref:HD domain-containing protein n=1 Tax=Roseisolibacter sp. H3M3-2 TaxID=3031323 RepID=UPI0023DC6099|nr:HD domain-containing protein [Roseisolibacter sp. H3M3-2]MDF1504463.1 HD domain-containing protein [Roseisolibacter sp. H3M3-2]